MLKVAEKLVKEGLVSPKSETDNNDQNQGNQSGSGSDEGGQGDEGGSDGGQSANPNDNNDSGKGGNAGDQQGAGAGADASEGSGSASGEDELSDEALVLALQKRGMNVKSLNEVGPLAQHEPTEAEKQELEAKRKNSVRAYALENNIVTSTVFDDYARESSMPIDDLAFTLYAQERIAEEQEANTPADQLPSEAELREDFDELYFRKATESDPKRRYAEKRLQNKVEEYLQTKYSSIYELEDKYNDHTATLQQRNLFNETVETVIASKVGTEMPYSFIGEDGKTSHSYPVKITEAQLNAAKSVLLSDKTFQILVSSGGISKETIDQTLKTVLREQNEQQYLSQVIHAHTSKKIEEIKKGRREIFNTTGEGEGGEGGKVINKNVKVQLEKNKNLLNTPT